jgi:hypothetical protein
MLIISNFDIANSEISQIFDFSGFMSLCYPNIKKDMNLIKDIICKDIQNASEYEGIIRKCIGSYNYSIANLNEFIINTKEIFEEYKNSATREFNKNEVANSLNYLSIAKDVENFKSKKKLKFLSKDTEDTDMEEFLNTANLSKLNLNVNGQISNKNYESKAKFKLDENIRKQIHTAPIHVQKIKNKNPDEEEFEKYVRNSVGVNNCNSADKITESLSKTQKILLLAAFFATESSPKLDSVTFKNVKKTRSRVKSVKKINFLKFF